MELVEQDLRSGARAKNCFVEFEAILTKRPRQMRIRHFQDASGDAESGMDVHPHGTENDSLRTNQLGCEYTLGHPMGVTYADSLHSRCRWALRRADTIAS